MVIEFPKVTNSNIVFPEKTNTELIINNQEEEQVELAELITELFTLELWA